MGTSDLSKELNVSSRRALQTSLQLVVLAAKKYNKVVLDGVYLNVKDLVGFEQECLEVGLFLSHLNDSSGFQRIPKDFMGVNVII